MTPRIAPNLNMAIKKIKKIGHGNGKLQKTSQIRHEVVFEMYPYRGVSQQCHSNTNFTLTRQRT